MLAACKQCGFQLTVATAAAATSFPCPTCAGPLVLLSVAELPSASAAPVATPPPELPVRKEIDIGLPGHDWAAWRVVLLGMKLLHRAVIGICILIAVFMVGALGLCCVLFNSSAPSPVAQAFFALVALVFLALVITMYVGLGLCCFAPAESGARSYAQGSFALTVAGSVALLVQALDLGRTAAGWLELPESSAAVGLIWYLVLLLNWALAVTCWLLFVRNVARRFRLADAVRGVRTCLIGATAWFTFMAFAPLFRIVGAEHLAIGSAVLGALMGMPLFVTANMHLLASVSEAVEIKVLMFGESPRYPA